MTRKQLILLSTHHSSSIPPINRGVNRTSFFGGRLYTLRVLTLRLLLLLPLAFALHADQVVLKNGDTITGSIVKKDGDKLTLKSEFLCEVTMPWTAVQSFHSDEPLTVELPNNERVLGKLTTT